MTNSESVKPNPVRALSLLSGGLDSQLAIRVLQSQGIEVQAIVFRSVFFGSEKGETAARRLAVPVIVEEFTPSIVALVRHPPHGFGSGLNPCIDCHIAMIRRAGQIMEERGCHFLSTGEVLNQRPMSQNRKALELIARESGYADRLLRPLSAQLIPETALEKQGWVDREQLCALEGRSRRAQVVLAMKLGVTEYPQPAGGCLLTDPGYARRLKELKEHEGLDSVDAIIRLRIGRHFRVGGTRLIVGRNQEENLELAARVLPSDLILQPTNCVGPFGVLTGTAPEEEIRQAAGICARYCDCPPQGMVSIEVRSGGETRVFEVKPIPPAAIEPLRI
ncbi:MAG: tRNA 4-thiouridine(8) synthase ThiI [Verrucomicrobia bacterium]|nr:tRNA 4-thiouridine(8) synthase ThiI [Verrucomicrobiota bacterium]MBU4292159.1 tRNA 4-thiouridine(8) synthase ThiI [Verrucomicrobiota bacterium]MBU4429433.1 tRNA 4-thiouridine(8) synthase ThiI [Verrucomicrobiota bacterium]MCG2681604.1 tRNA 4-thiouridine(8) synthase ThiI [Kiritimatiellia bacterium]